MRILLIVFTMFSLAFATGCGSRKKAGEQASLSPQERTQKAVESLQTKLDTLREEGKTDAVIPRIEAAMSDPAFTEAQPLLFSMLISELVLQDRVMRLNRAATTMLLEKLYSDDRRLLDTVEEQQPYGEAIQQWVIAARADLFLAEGRLDDADAFLWEHAAALTDPEAAPRFRELMLSRIKAGDSEASDGLARRAMGKLADLPATRDTIVTLWIEAAANAKDHHAFLDRTQEALNAKVSLRRLLSSFENGVYDVMSAGPDALRQRCTEIMQEMGGVEAEDESCAARLTLLSLDAAFYMKDFKEVLAVIERGIPGRDEDWHNVLINKASAHLALQEGRIDDAIGHFRAHMETVGAWEKAERDPATGIMMIKEAVLGFNEKRIGDIYDAAGRQAEAEQAYAAARKWYEKALKEVAAESEEFQTYMQEMALVPTT